MNDIYFQAEKCFSVTRKAFFDAQKAANACMYIFWKCFVCVRVRVRETERKKRERERDT